MNLIYVADPMCSWCYGFGRTLGELLADPQDSAPLQLALVMGGLRPFTTEVIAPRFAAELAGHWHHVAQASGQPFAASPATAIERPGFIYDTEPPSRATVTVRSHWPRLVWRYFEAIQRAFYAEARDITDPSVLADEAEKLGMPRPEFAQAFASQAMREATLDDFAQAQAWGIRGFPALIAARAGELHLVANGFMPIGPLRGALTQFADFTAH